MSLEVNSIEHLPVPTRAMRIAGLLLAVSLATVLLILDNRVYDLVHDSVFSRDSLGAMSYREQGLNGLGGRFFVRSLASLENWGEGVYVVVAAIAMWQLDAKRRSRVLFLVLSVALTTVSVEIVKRTVGRERPDSSHGAFVIHGPIKGLQGSEYQSFPSGHVAAAASYSGSIASFYPPLRPVCVFLAAGCATSRVWKERHFPSDCWVAALLGFWLGFALPNWRWAQKLGTAFDCRFSAQRLTEF